MKYDATARDGYRVLWQTCIVDPARRLEVEHSITEIIRGAKQYHEVGDATGVPWYVVGCLHLLECNCSFSHHLHNGDPLDRQTVHVPAERPPAPWPIAGLSRDELWFHSALDALRIASMDRWHDWSVPGILYNIERYNGFGYRSHDINSPYLWAASNHYVCGKYTADDKWSATAVSDQVGAAVVLRTMVNDGHIELPS